MFNLRKLEERIVLDGAAFADALEEIRDHGEYDEEMHLHAQDILDATDDNIDPDEPLYLTDGFDAVPDDGSGVHVLVISSDIDDADDLAAAAKDNVIVIRYDASDTTTEDLAKLINDAVDGQKADSIAFASHSGGQAQVDLGSAGVMSLDTLDDAELQNFWQGIGGLLNDDGRIDLLACDVLNGENGDAFLSKMEALSGANVAASTDATGNEVYGGDWVLESDGVDVQSTYFDADRLEKFDGVMNESPYVAAPITDIQYAQQGEEFTFTIPHGTIVDPEGDDLDYTSFAWQHPKWMVLEEEGKTFTGIPPLGMGNHKYVGESTVTVSAVDPDIGNYTTMNFKVVVNDTPEAPILVGAIADQTIAQTDTLDFEVPADLFADPEGQTILYSAVDITNPLAPISISGGDHPWLTFDPGTNMLSGKPATETDVGGYDIQVVATDSTNRGTGETFRLTVTSDNDPPYVNELVSIAPPDAEQGEYFEFTIPDGAFVDPEGGTLYYFSYPWQHPSWMVPQNYAVGEFDGTFSGTPTEQSHVGTFTVTVSAVDPSGIGYTTTTFQVTVNDTNDPPVLVEQPLDNELVGAVDVADDKLDVDSVTGNLIIEQHHEVQFSVADNYIDPDGDTVQYHAEIRDAGGAVIKILDDPNYWMYLDKTTGNFTVAPEDEDTVTQKVDGTNTGNPWTVRVWAYDTYGDPSDETSFTVDVKQFNDPPQVNEPIPTQVAKQGEEFVYTFTQHEEFLDPEGEALYYYSYPWQHPSWMIPQNYAVGEFDGTYRGTPPVDDESVVGTFTVTVSAVESSGTLYTTTSFQIIVEDTPGFDPEIIGIDGETLAYVEGTGAVVLDQVGGTEGYLEAAIEDVDSFNFDGGKLIVDIDSGFVLGQDQLSVKNDGGGAGQIGFFNDPVYGPYVTYGGDQIGDAKWDDISGTLTIDLTAAANVESVTALLQNITYENSESENPTEGDRILNFQFFDGDGGAAGTADDVSMTVSVSAQPSAPIIKYLEGDVVNYEEGKGAVKLDTGLVAEVTDADSLDFDGGYLEVKITDGFRTGDKIGIDGAYPATHAIGDVTYSPADNSVMTVTFNGSATPATVSALINEITYDNTNTIDPPEGPRKIRFILNDGDGGQTVIDPTVNVGGVNDHPVLEYVSDGDPTTAVEEGGPVLIDMASAALVTDVDSADFEGGILKIQITNNLVPAEDELGIQHQGKLTGEIWFTDGINVLYANEPIGTVASDPAQGLMEVSLNENATPEAVSALIHQVSYENTNSADPSDLTRTVSFQLFDGDSNPIGSSTIETMDVNVRAVNDSPVIDNVAGVNVNYAEGDGKVKLDPDSNAGVTDIDSLNFNDPGTLTVKFVGGYDSSEDVLDIVPGGTIGSTPAGITYNGLTIAPSATFDSANGQYVFEFDSGDKATPDAVADLIKTIAYENTNTLNPTEGVRTVQFQIYDGDYVSEPDGGTSQAYNMTVTIGPENDAPVIHNIDALDSITYQENDVALAVPLDKDSNAFITDVDSEDFAGGRLEVRIVGGLDSDEDVLAVRNEPGFGPDRLAFDGKDVTYSFKTIGEVEYKADSGLLTVDLTADADTMAVSKLIQNITYANTDSDMPTEGDRDIQFVFYDGDGGSSAIMDTIVTVEGVNDAPIIYDLQPDSVAFDEGDTAVVLDQSPAAYVIDVDNTEFSNNTLQVMISDGFVAGEDTLGINDQGPDGIAYDGSAVSYKGTLIGKWGNYDASSGILSVDLLKEADAEAVSALIQNVTYVNMDTGNLTEGRRTVQFTLTNDFHDTIKAVPSEIREVTVDVGDVNDAPVIHALDGETMLYQETEGVVIVDQSVAPYSAAYVTDVDDGNFEGGHLIVQIFGGDTSEDVLGVDSTGSGAGQIFFYDNQHVTYGGSQMGTVIFNANTGTMDIALTEVANETSVTALIQAITYENTDSYDPTAGERTIRFTLSDGKTQGVSADNDVTITVTSPNNPPQINEVNADTALYVEDADPVILDMVPTAAFVVDHDSPDFDGGYLDVQITTDSLQSEEDRLSIATQGNITFNGANIAYDGTPIGDATYNTEAGLLHIDLNENATPTAMTELVQSISFENINEGNPVEGSRVVEYTLWDGDGASSAYVSSSVTVQGVNDQPFIENIEGDKVTFVEGVHTAGVLLDASTNALVTDADNVTFSGGHLLVSVVDGVTTEDDIKISAGGMIGVNGSDVQYNAVTIGTFVSSGGVMDITLNASADASEVSELIQHIVYNNTNSGDPTAGQRTVRFQLDDGKGEANSTSPAYDMHVNVQPSNDPPIIGGFDTASILYYEGEGARVLDSALTLTDVDSPVFEGGRLMVEITDGLDVNEDLLSVQNVGTDAGQIGFNGSLVTYEGEPISDIYNYNNGELTIGLNENATTAAVRALMENITYQNTDEDAPTEGLRTIRFTAYDGDTAGSSNYGFITVGVAGINDAPVIENVNGDIVTFNEADDPSAAAVLLDLNGNAKVTDVDSTDFNGGTLTVTILNATADDTLSIRHEGVAAGDIGFYNGSVSYGGDLIGTSAFVAGTSTSTLTVSFTTADANANAVQALIQNVTFYNNNVLNPTEGQRTISFQLNDGDGSAYGGVSVSEYSYVTVNVVDTNDAPAIHELHGDTLVYTEGDGPVRVDMVGTAAYVSDPDSPNFEGGRLEVKILDTAGTAGYVAGEDVLSVFNEGSGTGQIGVFNNEVILYEGDQIGKGVFDPATGILDITLYDDATTTAVSELIQAIRYENTDTVNPTAGDRTVRFALYDGELNKTSDCDATITVVDVNDAPEIKNIGNDQAWYTEAYMDSNGVTLGGSAILLDQTPTAAFVTDNDTPNFGGGKLTVEISNAAGGFQTSEDKLSIRDQGNNLDEISFDGAFVRYEGQIIGTSAFVEELGNTRGVLTVFFNDNADTDAVSALVRNVTYENLNAEHPFGQDAKHPTQADTDRDVVFTLYDGDGTETEWGDSSEAVSMKLHVSQINDAPEVLNMGGDHVEYTIGYSEGEIHVATYVGGPSQGVALLDVGTDVQVTDVDSSDFDGGYLRIEFDTDVLFESDQDRIVIDNYSADGYSITYDSNKVYLGGTGGVQFGTVAYAPADGVMTISFDADATETAVSALLKHIGYQNTLATSAVVEGQRSIRFTLYDGDYFHAVDESAVSFGVTVNVDDSNDPPTINESAGAHDWVVNYTEGEASSAYNPVSLFAGSWGDIVDVDSPDFENGFVAFQIVANPGIGTLGYFAGEDMLGVATSGGDITYVGNEVIYNGSVIGTGGFNIGSGILRIDLTEHANETSVEALLDAVSFYNTNTGNPQEGYRTIRFMMSDGDGGYAPTDGVDFSVSPAATDLTYQMSVLVSGTNDAPAIANIEGDYTTFYEATDASTYSDNMIFIDQYSNASVFDADRDDHPGTVPDTLGFSSTGRLTVQISGPDWASDEDWLGISDNGNISVNESNYTTGDYGMSIGHQAYGGAQFATANFVEADGKLTIDFTSTGATMDMVSELIQSITYSNTDSWAPNPGERTVRFTLTDSTDVGGLSSLTYDMTVNVEATNDKPWFTSWETGGVALTDYVATPDLSNSSVYLEDSDGVYEAYLQSGAAIFDVDIMNASDNTPYGDFEGGFLKIEFETNVGFIFDADEDRLGIGTSSGISTLGEDIVMYNGAQIGVATDKYDGTVGYLQIDLNENSDQSGVSALIKSITYRNLDSDDPTGGLRSVRFSFNDGDSNVDGLTTGWRGYSDAASLANYNTTGMADMTFHVSGVNDAPVINNLESDVATFCQAAQIGNMSDINYATDGVVLDQGVPASLTDVDLSDDNYSNGGALSIWVLSDGEAGVAYSAEDMLHIRDADNNTATFAGSGIDISYGAAGTTVYYDGQSIGKLDYLAAGTAGTAGTTGVLTIDFSGATAANEEAVSALLQNISYVNINTTNPSDNDRTIRFQLWDGGDGTPFTSAADSMEHSESVEMLLHVNGANNAPTFESTTAPAAVDGIVYSEGDGDTTAWGAPGSQTVLLDENLTQVWINDSDGTDVSLSGGLLTIEFIEDSASSTIYEEGEDRLWFNSASDMGTSTVTYSGGNVYSGVAAGPSIGEVNWDGANGKLTVELLSGANTTTVSKLIQSITYQNLDSQDPTPGNRSIRFTITDDGNDSTAAAGLCPGEAAGESSWGFLSVHVFADNDAPEVPNFASDVVEYKEGTASDVGVFVDLGQNAYVLDVDSDYFSSFTISMTSPGDASTEDHLSIRHDGIGMGQVGFYSGSSNVSYSGNVVGSMTYVGGDDNNHLKVDFYSTANAEAVSEVIQNVVYYNTNTANPTTGNRTLRFELWDAGDGETAFGPGNWEPDAESVATYHYMTVNVVDVNDPPVINDLNGDVVEFKESDGAGAASDNMIAIDLSTNATVTDPDTTEFSGGKMEIKLIGGDITEDVLLFNYYSEAATFSDGVVFSEDSTDLAGNIAGTVGAGNSQVGNYYWDQAAGVLTIDNLTTKATTDAMNALIQNITYYNRDTIDPTAGDRTVRVVMWDGDGTDVSGPLGLSSAATLSTIKVQPTNDGPVINNLNGDTAMFFEESGPILLDDQRGVMGATTSYLAASVSDVDSPDFEGGTLKVWFDGGETAMDVLGIEHQSFNSGEIAYAGDEVFYGGTPIGRAIYYNDLYELKVDFNENATINAVDALMGRITFDSTNTADLANGERTIRYQLDDGDGATSNIATVTVTVSGVNDAPEIMNIAGDTLVYNEGDGKQKLDQLDAAAVIDVDTDDFSGGHLYVQIMNAVDGEDSLSATIPTAATNATAIYDTDTHILDVSLTNVAAAVSDVTFNSILTSVSYENLDTDTPTEGIRNVRFWMNDGDDSNFAIGDMPSSPTYDMTIKVQGVNDPPEMSDFGAMMTYVENDSAAHMLLVGTPTMGVITDIDSPNFEGGRLEVQIVDGLYKNEDVLSVMEFGQNEESTATTSDINGGTASGKIRVMGPNNEEVFYGADQIGTIEYTPANGKMVIELTEYANTQTVSELIQNITYLNTDSDTPTPGHRNISFTLYDGEGNADGGNEVSNSIQVTVNVSALNDAPEIFELEGDEVTYTEGGEAVIIDQDALAWVRDVDHANFNGGSLAVSFSDDTNFGHLVPADINDGVNDTTADDLTIKSEGDHWDQIKTDGANVYYGGAKIGTWATLDTGGSPDDGTGFWGNQLVVNFDTNNATPEAVSRLVQSIQYENTDTIDPVPGARTVAFQLFDPAGASSDFVAATVNVEAVNSAPVINAVDGMTDYYENDHATPQLAAGTDGFVTDLDSDDFAGGHLVVKITNAVSSEDRLGVQTFGDIFVGGAAGNQISYLSSGIGTFTYDEVSATLDVTLNDKADAAAVSVLVQNITYANTNSDNPVDSDREIEFTLSDGDGATSKAVTAQINVEPVNDRPDILNIQGDTVAFVEGGAPVVIDQNVAALVVDVDDTSFDGGYLKVEIVAGGDEADDLLFINNEGSAAGQISYMATGPNSGAVYFEGEQFGTSVFTAADSELYVGLSDAASPDAVSALIQNVSYENTDTLAPDTTPRNVEFVLNDGESDSLVDTATIHVVGLNTGPEIHDLDGDAVVYTEGAGTVVLDQKDFRDDPASLTDADTTDFERGHLYVEITGNYDNTEDTLTVNNEGGSGIGFDGKNGSPVTYGGKTIGIATWSKAAGELDVEFNSVNADADSVGALIRNIAYVNTDTVSVTEGDRTISFVMWDGGNGRDDVPGYNEPDNMLGASSNYSHVTVTVEGTNDPPVISNIQGDSANYNEGDDAILLDVNENGNVTDVDSPNFEGGRFEVQIVEGYHADEDVLTIRNESLTGGQIGFDGFDVTYNGTPIGKGGYDAGRGLLGIDLNENADHNAVSALIQNITYDNLSENDPTDGLRTIRFTVIDGDGKPKDDTGDADMVLNVASVNSRPILHNIAEDVLTYYENTGAAMVLDQGMIASVTDADSKEFDGGYLKVQIMSGFDPADDGADDVLGIDDQGNGMGQIGVDFANHVKYSNVGFGTLKAYDAGNHVLEISLDNDKADADSVSALIQSITYTNTDSNAPFEGERVVRFTMYDGDGTGGTSLDYDMSVNVIGVNDAPDIINLDGGTAIFREGDGLLGVQEEVLPDVGENAQVIDSEQNFDGGRLMVQVVGGDPTEDWLSVENEGDGFHQIKLDMTNDVFFGNVRIGHAEFDQSAGVLEVELNGDADNMSVSSLIQNITYNNTDSDNPTEGERILRYTLFDSDGDSGSTREAMVFVQGVNDGPVIENIQGDTVTFNEGGAPVVIDMGPDGLVSDVDTTEFSLGKLQVENVTVLDRDAADNSQELFSIQDQGTEAGQISFEGFEDFKIANVYYGDERIGVAQQMKTGALEVSFNDNADENVVSALIQSITYENTDTLDPTPGERTIRFNMFDGDYGDPNRPWIINAASDPVFATVNVVEANDAPVIQNLANDTLEYGKNDGLLALDQGADALVTDTDSANFNGGYLSVEITNGDQLEDRLGISTTVGQGISVAGNGVFHNSVQIGTYELDRNGTRLNVSFSNDDADPNVVSALVRSIGYENINTVAPVAGDRVVRFQIHDGDGPEGLSAAYEMNVAVEGNRPPVVDRGVAPDNGFVWEVNEGNINRYSLTAEDAFDDPDGDPLSFEAIHVDGDGNQIGTGELPSWLNLTSSGTFVALPDGVGVGVEVFVKLFASDDVPGSDPAETTFTVRVASEVNHKPYFVRVGADGDVLRDPMSGQPIIDPNVIFGVSEHEVTTPEGSVLIGTMTGVDMEDVENAKVMVRALDDDLGDTDNLTYRITGGNGAGNFSIDPDTGEIRLVSLGENTETEDDDINFETGPKAFTLHVEVKDDEGAVDIGTLTITIDDENDQPIATEPVDQQLLQIGKAWFYNIEEPDDFVPEQTVLFTDEDEDNLTYTATLSGGNALPGWLNFAEETNTFIGSVPNEIADGTIFTIEVVAKDGNGGTAVSTFEIKTVSDLGGRDISDALGYLEMTGGEDFSLPADGEDVEIHDIIMYAQSPVQETMAADDDMMEALSLLEFGDM